MLVPFENLPADARLWIYQSGRPFTADEVVHIQKTLASFVDNWTAHSRQLAGGFDIRYNLFLIVGIDEQMAMASGCSIDKSVHIMRQLEQELKISLLERMIFAYKKDGVVLSVTKKEFESKLQSGEITEDTIVFNNLVDRKSDLANKWEVPLKDSWHKQVFAQRFFAQSR